MPRRKTGRGQQRTWCAALSLLLAVLICFAPIAGMHFEPAYALDKELSFEEEGIAIPEIVQDLNDLESAGGGSADPLTEGIETEGIEMEEPDDDGNTNLQNIMAGDQGDGEDSVPQLFSEQKSPDVPDGNDADLSDGEVPKNEDGDNGTETDGEELDEDREQKKETDPIPAGRSQELLVLGGDALLLLTPSAGMLLPEDLVFRAEEIPTEAVHSTLLGQELPAGMVETALAMRLFSVSWSLAGGSAYEGPVDLDFACAGELPEGERICFCERGAGLEPLMLREDGLLSLTANHFAQAAILVLPEETANRFLTGENGSDAAEAQEKEPEGESDGSPADPEEQTGEPVELEEMEASVMSVYTGLPAATAGITERSIETRILSVTAAEVSGTELTSITAEILDEEENVLQTLVLTAETDWSAEWEAPADIGTCLVRFASALDAAGEEVGADWSVEVEAEAAQTETAEPELQWNEQTELSEGIYAFSFGDTELLLSASTASTKKSGVYYYMLSGVSARPEDAGSTEQWSVTAAAGGLWYVVNMATAGSEAGYLNIQSSGKVCGAVTDGIYAVRFAAGAFCNIPTGASIPYYVLYSGGNFTGSTSASTTFRLFRKELVTETVTKEAWMMKLNRENVEETASCRVSLSIEGNIADRTERFVFLATVNGELFRQFTLGHGETYLLEEIPVGSTLTVLEDARNYTAVSSMGALSGGESFTLSPVPQGDTGLLFTNTLEGTIQTGVRPDDGPALCILILSIPALLRSPIHSIIFFILRRKRL